MSRQPAVQRRPVPADDPQRAWQLATFAFGLLATCYSGALAIGLAHGMPGGFGLVVLCELALLGAAGIMVLWSGLTIDDAGPILFLYTFVILAILLSLTNERPMLEVLRSALIIGIFSMAGHRMGYRTLDRLFLVLSTIVLLVLVLEIASLPTYVSLFQPARFFEATRGIQASEYNELGLFNTATSFEGRFAFGLFNVPRTSSIFLEQISNANFACIAAIYLSARWKDLTWFRRGFIAGTIFLILVTTNARFASLLVAGLIAGYWIFPLLPRRLTPLASLGLALAAIAIILRHPDAIGDDLQGRLAHVGRRFAAADFSFYLGSEANTALGERDSGYSYLIGSSSIFGMIALWFYLNLYPRADDAMSRKVLWGTIAYMLGQLMVSSTSLLSIKTAALLWLMVGCIRGRDRANYLKFATAKADTLRERAMRRALPRAA